MGRRVAIDAATSSGSGRDGLNLCKGEGEGTAALAKTARPSAFAAFPAGGPEVSRTALPRRCPRKPPVGRARVVYLRHSSCEEHDGLRPHPHAKVSP